MKLKVALAVLVLVVAAVWRMPGPWEHRFGNFVETPGNPLGL